MKQFLAGCLLAGCLNGFAYAGHDEVETAAEAAVVLPDETVVAVVGKLENKNARYHRLECKNIDGKEVTKLTVAEAKAKEIEPAKDCLNPEKAAKQAERDAKKAEKDAKHAEKDAKKAEKEGKKANKDGGDKAE